MVTNLSMVFIGGGIGSVVRLGISMLVYNYFRAVFPVATLCSNILSCLVMGIGIYLAEEKLNADTPLRFLLITGFCGGFSTFSAFSFETVELMKNGNTAYAILNIALSLATCLGIIYFFTRTHA